MIRCPTGRGSLAPGLHNATKNAYFVAFVPFKDTNS